MDTMSDVPAPNQLLELWADDPQRGFAAAIEVLKTDRWNYVAWDVLMRGLLWQQNYGAAFNEASQRISDLLVDAVGASEATRAAYYIAELAARGVFEDADYKPYLDLCMRPFMVGWEAIRQGELPMQNCLYFYIPNAIETANALERAADLRIPHSFDYTSAAAELRTVVFQMLDAYTGAS